MTARNSFEGEGMVRDRRRQWEKERFDVTSWSRVGLRAKCVEEFSPVDSVICYISALYMCHIGSAYVDGCLRRGEERWSILSIAAIF